MLGMNIEQRIKRCRLIKKMEEFPEFSKKLGLENKSRLQRRHINDKQACSLRQTL